MDPRIRCTKNKIAFLTLATTLALVTGCHHKPVNAPTPPLPAPLPQPAAGLKELPAVLPTNAPTVVLYEPAPKPKPQPRKEHRRHAWHPSTAASTKKSVASSATSSGQEPSSMTPIGLLTTAPEAISRRDARSIEAEINAIRDHIHAIHRALNTSEEQTVTEIQTFLQKAQNALQAGDLDGAHTLTVKARVLLSELRP